MKNLKSRRSRHIEKGFTLVELMISLSIGLVLFAGVISIFIGMRTTSAETSSYGELQENGRFAISVLTEDLLRQNFWGDLSGDLNDEILSSTPDAPGNECNGNGLNNGTFPAGAGYFRTLWGQTIAGNLNPMGCFSDPTYSRVGSDIIQFKRVISNPVVATSVDDYYLIVNSSIGGIFTADKATNAYAASLAVDAADDAAAAAIIEAAAATKGTSLINAARMWEYQHHVYYIKDKVVGSNSVPTLIQGRLAGGSMVFSPVIDGIEMIRFMYGVDDDTEPGLPGYGTVDSYISADNITDDIWNNTGGTRILAVKIFVLARGVLPDTKYTNTNSYQLGDFTYNPNPDDNFRRLLFTTTVSLYNNGEMSW